MKGYILPEDEPDQLTRKEQLESAALFAAGRLEWAIKVFESHGDFTKLPWDRAEEWLPHAAQAVEEIKKLCLTTNKNLLE